MKASFLNLFDNKPIENITKTEFLITQNEYLLNLEKNSDIMKFASMYYSISVKLINNYKTSNSKNREEFLIIAEKTIKKAIKLNNITEYKNTLKSIKEELKKTSFFSLCKNNKIIKTGWSNF